MKPCHAIAAIFLTGVTPAVVLGQQVPAGDTASQMQHLEQSIEAVESQLQESQRQLLLLKQQLSALQAATGNHPVTSPAAPVEPATSSSITEQQEMQASQIATLDQAKVESESSYPVKISGMILLNGFANSAGTDVAAVPTSAIGGPGNTGMSLRQTMLGISAHGPHLAGAETRADLQVDFFGSSSAGGYNDAGGLLRLRTAHASLQWKRTQAFFALDRPILNPQSPTSLTAVAEPALAWSGNLWNWVPQLGLSYTMGENTRLRLQAAMIDPPDAPYPALPAGSAIPSFNLAEHSRLPGVEGRIALLGKDEEQGFQVGTGAYFSRHTITGMRSFDAWAGTVDLRTPLWHSAQISGNAYFGRALGGLGGGAYKDYVYRTEGAMVYLSAPRDVGGWLQWKQRFGQRLEWNSAFGLDNVYASDLRPYTLGTALYSNTTRNRSITSNLIFSPSAYLLLSFEYRRLTTWPTAGSTWNADIYGVAVGYRF
jgi:hypothetical protein